MTKKIKMDEANQPATKKYETIDIMMDLETIGLGDNVVITQIGAVAFILGGDTLANFDESIGVRSCIEHGLVMEGGAATFWYKQELDVFRAVFLKAIDSDVKLEDVLNKFTAWLKQVKKDFGTDHRANVNVWGNGMLADNKWIKQAYIACKLDIPWNFTEDRDVRTIVNLAKRLKGFDIKKIIFEGKAHNALDDCKHQIKYLNECFKVLKDDCKSQENGV